MQVPLAASVVLARLHDHNLHERFLTSARRAAQGCMVSVEKHVCDADSRRCCWLYVCISDAAQCNAATNLCDSRNSNQRPQGDGARVRVGGHVEYARFAPTALKLVDDRARSRCAAGCPAHRSR